MEILAINLFPELNDAIKEDSVLDVTMCDELVESFDYIDWEDINWGNIESWWIVMKQWLEENIQRYTEIVILDARWDWGREFIQRIQEAKPKNILFSDIDNVILTMCVNNDNTIAKIAYHTAVVKQRDQYDSMQSLNRGILRIDGRKNNI